MGIEFRVGNRRVREGQFAKEVMKELNKGLRESLEKHARSRRCPVHGRPARLVSRGGRYSFEGCCEEFLQTLAED